MRWYIAGHVGGWFISLGVPPVWFGAGINHLTDHGHFINHLVDERAAHNQLVDVIVLPVLYEFLSSLDH